MGLVHRRQSRSSQASGPHQARQQFAGAPRADSRKSRRISADTVLDQYQAPVVILDGRIRLRRMNRAARGLFDQLRRSGRLSLSCWLRAVRQDLRCRRPSAVCEPVVVIAPPNPATGPMAGRSRFQIETVVLRNRQPVGRPQFLCLLLPRGEPGAEANSLTHFFELSADLFCIASLDGFFLTTNARFSQKLGYSSDELTGRPFLAFIHPEDLKRTQAEMQRLGRGENVIAFRNRYRDVHDVYHWFEWTARPMLDDGVVYASARDVTSQVEMERQLVQQERRERAILDNTSALIYVKDNQGRYQFINREFSRQFGVSADEIVGKTDFDLFPAGMATEFQRNDHEVLTTRASLKIEEVAPHADGPHNYLTVKFPLFDMDGGAMSVAGISTDISDRVWLQRTHQELRLAQQVQRRLFPVGDLKVPGFDIHGRVLAASHLCGDYFDYIVRPSGRLACCVADVSGHGIGPALEMVETRAMLRMLLKENHSLGDTMQMLNLLLYEDMPDSSFVTMFLAEIDQESRQFTYVGAGHNAILMRADGTFEIPASTGPVLGLMANAQFLESPVTSLNVGDLLLISTDGIVETLSSAGELFGVERVCRVLEHCREQTASEILNELFGIAQAFSREPVPRDDMTGILLKVVGDTCP